MSEAPSINPISIRDVICPPSLVVIHDSCGRDARFAVPLLGRVTSKRMLGEHVLGLRCQVIGGGEVVVPAGYVAAAGPVALVTTAPVAPLQ